MAVTCAAFFGGFYLGATGALGFFSAGVLVSSFVAADWVTVILTDSFVSSGTLAF